MHARALYYGDNLYTLREMESGVVDLVYLDPPFNSDATYNVLFRAPSGQRASAQIQAFEDTWHWGDEAEIAYTDILASGSSAAGIVRALRTFLGENDMMAYLVMMTVRLIELHRVLRTTGSLYLHCDPKASHYLKIILDGIFGAENFQNEIIWKRTSAHSSAKRYGPVHDVLLFYSKGRNFTWNRLYQDYDQEYIDAFYVHQDENGRRWRRSDLTGAGTRNGATGMAWREIDVAAKGRHWAHPPDILDQLDAEGRIHWPRKKGGVPQMKRYLDEQPGMPLQDVWTDIRPMHNLSAERLGYATQKPLPLLERIIASSSNEGDFVLDPFCGCGTAVHAAERLRRNWAGMDVTHLAIQVIESRLNHYYPSLNVPVFGRPNTLDGARDLAERSKHQFELWAVWLARGFPRGGGKKGMDRGVDGDLYFKTGGKRDAHAVISVKGGKRLGPTMLRDLKGTRERENADLALFISLEEPTQEMRREAASSGVLETDHFVIPRVQIFTIEELLTGEKPVPAPVYDIPVAAAASRRSTNRRAVPPDGRQREMLYTFPEHGVSAAHAADPMVHAPADAQRVAAQMPPYLRARPKWSA